MSASVMAASDEPYVGPERRRADRRRSDPTTFAAYGDVMSSSELARVLGVDKETAVLYCKNGGLPHRHPKGSRKWLILKSEAIRWLRGDPPASPDAPIEA